MASLMRRTEIAHERADLEQLETKGCGELVLANCVCLRPMRRKALQENVGEGGKPQPQLIGAHGRRRGAVGKQVGLAFLDPVLHVATGAVDLRR